MQNYKIKLKIKEVITSRNMTQKELARITGIRESTISELSRGTKTAINFQYLGKIAEALNITDIRELIDCELTRRLLTLKRGLPA